MFEYLLLQSLFVSLDKSDKIEQNTKQLNNLASALPFQQW